jgi:uncharacterized protein (DUF433 family)
MIGDGEPAGTDGSPDSTSTIDSHPVGRIPPVPIRRTRRSPGMMSLLTYRVSLNPDILILIKAKKLVAGREKMDWKARILVDPKVLVGKPVVKGTRMAVEFIIDLMARGWTTEQILEEYDHLTAEDIQACLAYASEILKSERVYVTSP